MNIQAKYPEITHIDVKHYFDSVDRFSAVWLRNWLQRYHKSYCTLSCTLCMTA